MAGFTTTGAGASPLSLAPIILLISTGWILNWASSAPVAVIERDLNYGFARREREKPFTVQNYGGDNIKTDSSGRTDDDHDHDETGNGPPVLQLPEFVIHEPIRDGNRSNHNDVHFSQSERHGVGEEGNQTGILIVLEYEPSLVLRCSGKGNPKPNATWELDGGNLPHYVVLTGLTYSSEEEEGNDLSWVDLRLPKLNNAFYGRLRCLVQNKFGNASWEVDLIPNANSSFFMKVVRCTFATVFMFMGILFIKTLLWLHSKRKERLYEKLPPQDLEIINKFRKGLPPPPPTPSSSILPPKTKANCVTAAIEITVTGAGDSTTNANEPVTHGYRLVKGSSSSDFEKKFLNVINGGCSGANTPTSCKSVHVVDAINSWTNYVPYDNKLETSSQDFRIEMSKMLENGNYGMVFLGKIRNDLTMEWSTVAVKSGKCERDDNFMLESILTELKILASLPKAHDHIVNLRGAYTKMLHKRQVFVFVDHCEFGNLASFIDLNRSSFTDDSTEPTKPDQLNSSDGKISDQKKNRKEVSVNIEAGNDPKLSFSPKELVKWSWQIADGMNFLHKNRIIHGNLSTVNVFLTKGLTVKIGNIGYPPAEEAIGCIDFITKKWAAVPNYDLEQFSKKSDIWDYGKVLWEVFSLREQQCPSREEVWEFLGSDERGMEIPDYASSEVFDIILCCWNDNGTFRPEFDFFARVFKHFYKAMSTPPVKPEEEPEATPTPVK